MNTIVASWSEITTEIITNCFRHSGFVSKPDDGKGVRDEDDDIPLVQVLAAPHGIEQ